MLLKMHKRHGQKGFTLIELLIVVAIIGIIAAILIPNLIDALQKAKQKRTVADVRNMGTAWMTWFTEMVSATAAGATTTTFIWDSEYAFNGGSGQLAYADVAGILEGTDLASLLSVPDWDVFYIQKLENEDGWGFAYQFGGNFDPTSSANWSALIAYTRAIGIRSPGRDNILDASYIPGSFLASNYDEDIVWADGYFVRWPAGINTADDTSAP